MRSIIWSLIASLALVSVATPAAAASKDDLKKAKEEVKYHQGRAKDFAKLAKKWQKADEKGKDTQEIHAELKELYKDELASLREKGIETVEGDLPSHPQHPELILPDTEDRAKLEALRDLLVALKTTKDGDDTKKYSKNLDEASTILTERADRKAEKYAELKKS
jgi:hypothetical protein